MALTTGAMPASTLTSSIYASNLPAQLPTCAQQCIQTVAPALGSCSSQDVHCLCSNTIYVDTLACCISDGCNTTDQKKALKINQEICAAVSVNFPDTLGCAAGASSELANIMASGSAVAASGLMLSPSTLFMSSVSASTIAAFESAPSIATTGQVASYTGQALLTGSCTTPVFVSVTLGAGNGYLEYPWLGCSNQNGKCCPFDPDKGGKLSVCPSDYTTIGDGCCPFGWTVYSTAIAGQTPCATNPPLPLIPNNATGVPLATAGVLAISTQLFSQQFSLGAPQSGHSLPIGAIAGIAAGGAVMILILIFATAICYRRRHKASCVQDLSNTPISSPTFETNFSRPMSTALIKQTTGESFEPNSPARDKSPTTPVQDVLWFPVPVPLEHRRPSRAATPSELAGDTYLHEHHPGVTGVISSGGDQGGSVGDPFARSVMEGAGKDTPEREKEMLW